MHAIYFRNLFVLITFQMIIYQNELVRDSIQWVIITLLLIKLDTITYGRLSLTIGIYKDINHIYYYEFNHIWLNTTTTTNVDVHTIWKTRVEYFLIPVIVTVFTSTANKIAYSNTIVYNLASNDSTRKALVKYFTIETLF